MWFVSSYPQIMGIFTFTYELQKMSKIVSEWMKMTYAILVILISNNHTRFSTNIIILLHMLYFVCLYVRMTILEVYGTNIIFIIPRTTTYNLEVKIKKKKTVY